MFGISRSSFGVINFHATAIFPEEIRDEIVGWCPKNLSTTKDLCVLKSPEVCLDVHVTTYIDMR